MSNKTRKRPSKKKAQTESADVESTALSSAESLPEVHQPRAVVPKVEDPLLSAYLREVHRYPLLTRDEEKALAIRYYETRDRESLHKLVTSNLRFVVKIAYEYVHYRVKLLDLIQEGNTGLLKAVEEFNPYRDVRLTTYAVWWIRSYIQDALLKNHSLVKMGTTQAQKKLFYRLRREQRNLEREGFGPNNTKLLASRLDVREKDVIEMDQRLTQGEVSLNAPVHADEKKERMDLLVDPSEAADVSLGEAEQRKLFGEILAQFAATLAGRDREIFESRLVSETPMTLQEIGDKYGVSKERARQLEEQIKGRLKNYVSEHYPDYDLLAGDHEG